MTAVTPQRRVALHRRALRLEYFTIGWNVIEAFVAIGARLIAGSIALVGFGVDSSIEVISALGLLWRLRAAGPTAEVREESVAEKRALYVVAVTFLLLAAHITYEAAAALVSRAGAADIAGRAAPVRAPACDHAVLAWGQNSTPRSR